MSPRVRLLAILISVASVNAQMPDAGQRGDSVVPRSWNIQLDPDDIDSVLKPAFESDSGVMPQQGQNQYLAIMASVWDAKLLITYVKLSQKLTGAEKRKLESDQAAWLKRREAQAKEASEGEGEGSLAPTLYSEAFIKVTRERNLELQKRLDPAESKVAAEAIDSRHIMGANRCVVPQKKARYFNSVRWNRHQSSRLFRAIASGSTPPSSFRPLSARIPLRVSSS